MKIIIGQRNVLKEQRKSHLYEIFCDVKLRKDTNRESVKTDIRAMCGVTIVDTVPGSERKTDSHVFQVFKIKFEPRGETIPSFVKKVSQSMRGLRKKGLISFHFKPQSLRKIEI